MARVRRGVLSKSAASDGTYKAPSPLKHRQSSVGGAGKGGKGAKGGASAGDIGGIAGIAGTYM